MTATSPFTGIDHPAIACRDVAKLADWYCNVLGMRVIARGEGDHPAVLVGYGDRAGASAAIELMHAADQGQEPATHGRFSPGLRHVAINVNDFDAAYARLKQAGVVFTTEPGTALGGGRTI